MSEYAVNRFDVQQLGRLHHQRQEQDVRREDWLLDLDGTDIADRYAIPVAIHRPRQAALVVRVASAIISVVDSRAVPQQGMGPGRATIFL